VEPGAANAQSNAEAGVTPPEDPEPIAPEGLAPNGQTTTTDGQPARQPTRFYGTVALDSTRVGRDAGRIADEVIAHLAGLMGAEVKVVLEIEAHVPRGAPDNVVRTVTENSRTLKFSSHGFENV
jgi:hypothetical protein